MVGFLNFFPCITHYHDRYIICFDLKTIFTNISLKKYHTLFITTSLIYFVEFSYHFYRKIIPIWTKKISLSIYNKIFFFVNCIIFFSLTATNKPPLLINCVRFLSICDNIPIKSLNNKHMVLVWHADTICQCHSKSLLICKSLSKFLDDLNFQSMCNDFGQQFFKQKVNKLDDISDSCNQSIYQL